VAAAVFLLCSCCSFAEGSEKTFGHRAFDRVRNTQIGQPQVGTETSCVCGGGWGRGGGSGAYVWEGSLWG
jgi:hypothetical protein